MTRHARALSEFAESPMSQALERAPVADSDYTYTYRAGKVQAAGRENKEGHLDWSFGAGAMGFTAMGTQDGRFFEHRVSWLTLLGRVTVTPGQPAHGELGVFKTPAEAFACFNCHSTGLQRDGKGAPLVASMTPGIQCERCHGPASSHIADPGANFLFPGNQRTSRASVEFCGGCHRISGDLKNPVTVRFQPVGLMASRCFQQSGKLSCLTCHDPHMDAVRNNDAYYNEKCLGCHTSKASDNGKCRRNTKTNCLPCHMVRAELTAGMAFTDHRIH